VDGTAESAPECSRGVRLSFLAYSSLREVLLARAGFRCDSRGSAEASEYCAARSSVDRLLLASKAVNNNSSLIVFLISSYERTGSSIALLKSKPDFADESEWVT